MLLCAWRRSAVAKKDTLSGKAMIRLSLIGHATGHSTCVAFGAVPHRRIDRKAFYYNTIT